MFHFERGRPGQLPEILAFANEAFAMEARGKDFSTLHPKLYGPGAQSEALHTLLYEDGRLVGLFALQTADVHAAGRSLRAGWIGTVCVDSRARGRGCLSLLMEEANRQLEQKGCALGVLGGQRQRYQPYGYERGGSHWRFAVEERNLRGLAAGGVCVRELRQEDAPAALALFGRQPVVTARSEETLLQTLRSRGCTPFGIWHGGAPAGYCTMDGGGFVTEFVLDDPALLPGALGGLLARTGGRLELLMPPWPGPCQRALADFCGKVYLEEDHSYRVIDWPGVLNAALALRRKYGPPLVPGVWSAHIDGRPLRIEATDTSAVCRAAAEAQEDPQLTHHQALRLLLCPDSTLAPGAPDAPAGWFPLSFALPWADAI